MVKRSYVQRFITVALSTMMVLAAVPVMTQIQVVQATAQTKVQTKEEFYIDDIQQTVDVPEEWNTSGYWLLHAADPFGLQMNQEGLELLNEVFWSAPDTGMQDLMKCGETVNAAALGEALHWKLTQQMPNLMSAYFLNGSPVTQEFCAELANNIIPAEAAAQQPVQYAVCTTRAQLRAYPSLMPVTGIAGNPDTDYGDAGMLRVNEPVVIQTVSADGAFYYVSAAGGSGWVNRDYVAVCTNREQWLAAWQFEQSELLVVLEESLNVTGYDGKQYPVTMGTKLRLISTEQTGQQEGISAAAGYEVLLPKRQADGSYGTVTALISQEASVSAGYPALNTAAILLQAFQWTNPSYGWTSSVQRQDSAGMIRDIYQCFGLELPMGETGQQMIHADQYQLANMTQEEKSSLLDALSTGTLLFGYDRELLYVGGAYNSHYAIGTLDMAEENAETGQIQVVRKFTLFALEDTYTDGKSWLEGIQTAVVPYSPAKDIAFAGMLY